MKIAMDDKNIIELYPTVYTYNGSIQSDEDLVIVVPDKMTLDVNGEVRAKGNIIVEGGSLHADGGIASNGSIICAGALCSEVGCISAVNEIRAGESVTTRLDIICTDGNVYAPVIWCDTLSCNNYDELIQSANVTLGAPDDYVEVADDSADE